MTCIAGYVDKKKKCVYIGGDSAAVGGFNITIRKDTKVFRNGDFVIGCTTSFRMIQLLRFSFIPPSIGNKEIYEYMCTDFVNEIRTCFTDGGFIQKAKAGDDMGGQFLVGYKDRLFFIDSDFQVGESVCGYDSVGCGHAYANGAFYVIDAKSIKTEDKVTEALKAAAFFSAGVQGPFLILNTK